MHSYQTDVCLYFACLDLCLLIFVCLFFSFVVVVFFVFVVYGGVGRWLEAVGLGGGWKQ
jgi:hypothetical protein